LINFFKHVLIEQLGFDIWS